MKPWPPLIPAELDDADLTAQEVRVICRIARRGECWEGASGIASGCRLSENTVWTALKRLESWGVIERRKRTGQTSVFTLCPPHKWKIQRDEPGANQTPTSAQTRRRAGGRKGDAEGSAQRRRHKGIPKSRMGAKVTVPDGGEGSTELHEFRNPGEEPEGIHIPVHRT